MKKVFRAAILACLLALPVLIAPPIQVFAGDANSPGYECTENCPPPSTPPADPATAVPTLSSVDTEAPPDGLLTTIFGILADLTDLL